jgi:aminoglycoside phosphotransferase (APT) family kinase protein
MDEKLLGIPGANDWKRISKIEAGWSIDEKYMVEHKDGSRYLVRLSPIEYHAIKQKEFEILKNISHKNITHPIDCGICNGGKTAYLIFHWVEGVEVEPIISKMSALDQYKLGLSSGVLLKEIHGLKIGKQDQTWSERYSKKIERNIKNYLSCGYQIEGFSEIINYIRENVALLNNRKQTAQHGDYHIGNMLLTPSNEIAVIDFNRFDIGDPWEEFNRITWSSSESRYFATGQINGYFNGEIPEAFFKLLALYIGSNQLAAIPWAMKFGDDEVATMIAEANKVLEAYDNYKAYMPKWYMGTNDVVMDAIAYRE